MHPFQSQFEAVVRDGHVVPDSLWGQRVDAINVQIPLIVSPELQRIRDAIRCAEDGSLAEIPDGALHVSVLWILAARVDYGEDRLLAWERISAPVIAAFASIAEKFQPFQIHFTNLVATDTTVLLLGEDHGEMADLRSQLKRELPLPELTVNRQDIIHSTLFRYRSKLQNPARFLTVLQALSPNFAAEVSRIEIRHEVIYPSLESNLITGRDLGVGLTISS